MPLKFAVLKRIHKLNLAQLKLARLLIPLSPKFSNERLRFVEIVLLKHAMLLLGFPGHFLVKHRLCLRYPFAKHRNLFTEKRPHSCSASQSLARFLAATVAVLAALTAFDP